MPVSPRVDFLTVYRNNRHDDSLKRFLDDLLRRWGSNPPAGECEEFLRLLRDVSDVSARTQLRGQGFSLFGRRRIAWI